MYHPVQKATLTEIKKAWFVGYNVVSEYNLFKTKNSTRLYAGIAAQLGMDVFNAIEYNYATGMLHLTTDDHNVKSVDLFRMVPVMHTDLKTNPTALLSRQPEIPPLFSAIIP